MNPAELVNIARAERDHWWYCGMRSVISVMLRRHLAGRGIARVLEAGCGTGFTSDWLQRRYGWNVFSIDLERAALEFARNFQLPNTAQADIRSLPFSQASFDLVFCFDVLVHLSPGDEARAMTELFRVTAGGGLVVLRVAAFNALRSRHSEFIGERQRFTRQGLVRTAVRSGFHVLRCTYANSLLFPVAIAKFRIWEPLMRKPSASGVEPVASWLNALLYAALAVEAKWLESGMSLPLGQSLILIGEKPALDG